MKIKNEKTVLYGTSLKVSNGTKPHRIVIRHLPNEYKPYVTHMENMKLEDLETFVHEFFYSGHYFSSMEDAVQDFKERSNGF